MEITSKRDPHTQYLGHCAAAAGGEKVLLNVLNSRKNCQEYGYEGGYICRRSCTRINFMAPLKVHKKYFMWIAFFFVFQSEITLLIGVYIW